ncbi:MAG: flippase-like domain-containing protein [Oscillospiraceae bacterium]|jgi:uncharacterized protein (TIRG00374 family)|nr:flippase-like domain-containing protein [Oscillospiraceae bacterium]
MTRFGRALRKHLFTVIVLAVTMGILLFSLFKEKSISQLGQIYSTLDPFWILLAFATLGVTWLLEGTCNWLFCRHLYPNWTYGRSFMIGITGIFYCSITPFSSGGQPMQIYYMAKMGMQPGKSAAIISAKTITHQTTTLIFSLILIATELPFFIANVPHLYWFTIFGLVTNIIFIAAVVLVSVNAGFIYRLLHACLIGLNKIHIVKEPEKTYQTIVNQLDSFHEGFKTMGKDWRLYVLVCTITCLQLVLGSLDTYCVYRAFHLHGASVWRIIAAEVFSAMVVTFVPLPGGSGGAEVSFEAFCRIFFGTLTKPAMLIWRLITYYGTIVFGYLFVLLGSRRYIGSPPPEEVTATREAEEIEETQETGQAEEIGQAQKVKQEKKMQKTEALEQIKEEKQAKKLEQINEIEQTR